MTLLNEKGFEARHMCAVSSHKNEAMIRNYVVKCPDTKKREMSESLSSAMQLQKLQKVQDFPEDPLLQDVDWDSDEILVQVLEKIEKENTALAPATPASPVEIASPPQNALVPQPGPAPVMTVQNNVANVGGPKFPMMYFPHSNVTTKYHMHQ